MVEGPDDFHVIEHLWRQNRSDMMFKVVRFGGYSQLRQELPDYVVSPGRETLGVVADANDDIGGRWQSIANQLSKRNVELPRMPDPAGTIVAATEDTPKVGVWLMPNNVDAGELEDFVAQMIPQSDLVWPRSRDYINGIPAEDRKFAVNKTTRAQVHAWLAAREDPRRMGTAIAAGDLDVAVPLAVQFVDWLVRLFGEPAVP